MITLIYLYIYLNILQSNVRALADGNRVLTQKQRVQFRAT
jgi:hypothetical protein